MGGFHPVETNLVTSVFSNETSKLPFKSQRVVTGGTSGLE
jgi:hypothetical protein